MSLLVKIRKNDTGEVRTYVDEDAYKYAEGWKEFYPDSPLSSMVHHMWGEGNFSCDCNRELFFIRALDLEDEDDPDDPKCGKTRFSVLEIKDTNTGIVLYDEEADRLHKNDLW